MFHSLLREFQRSGFRASPHFVRQSFFGGKGGFLLGGLFLFGRLAGPALYRSASKNLEKKPSLLKDLSNSVKSLLSSNSKATTEPQAQPVERGTTSIEYTMHLTEAELQDGKVIQVATSGPDGQEVLKVKIPPGSRAGQKLRLRGKGQDGPDGRGDLFILLERTAD